jgi:ABC-type multidrug transport system ATPase subunit
VTPAADGDRTDREEQAAPEAAAARPAAKRPAKAKAATGASGTAKRTTTSRAKATTGEPGAKRSAARSGTTARSRPATPRVAAAQQAPDTVRERAAAPTEPAPAVSAEEPPTRELPPEPGDAGERPTRELPPAEPSAVPPSVAEGTTEILPVTGEAPTLRLPAAQAPAAATPEVPAPPVPKPAPAPDATASRFKNRPVLRIDGLTKRFGPTLAVAGIDLVVQPGSFYGIVGPNGAGKTTTLSMITGLLRPDTGSVHVHGIDVWREPERAKRAIGVLPDALRLFDRLSGAQLLHYSGVLRGLEAKTVERRSADLVQAFGLEDATGRLVADYSAGMTKKIALACAMIHSPRLLVLDEPFESVDPVSAANIIEILQRYVRAGGTVVLSSHGMDLIQRICDHVAIIIGGRVLASGTIDEVRGDQSLEERFVDLAGGRKAAEGLEWLHSFSD